MWYASAAICSVGRGAQRLSFRISLGQGVPRDKKRIYLCRGARTCNRSLPHPFTGQMAGLSWYECEYDGNLRSMALAIILSDGRRWQI